LRATAKNLVINRREAGKKPMASSAAGAGARMGGRIVLRLRITSKHRAGLGSDDAIEKQLF